MTEDQFWGRVGIPTDLPDAELIEQCWPWLGGKNQDGYGVLRLNGQVRYAFHVAYELCWGALPVGLVRRHRCNWRVCCNPFHLVAGTQRENIHDTQAAGTLVKLTAAQVVELRRRRAAGESSGALAREFGVSAGRVRNICRAQPDSWRWLEGEDVDAVSGQVRGGSGGAAGAQAVPGQVPVGAAAG